MSSIPKLLESTFEDFGLLARQYAQLTALKVKKSSKYGLLVIGSVSAAALLFLIVIAELIFSLASAMTGLEEVAQTAVLAAGFTTIIVILFGFIGWTTLKKIDLDPRASSYLKSADFDLALNPLLLKRTVSS